MSIPDEATRERLRRQIDAADVSAASKAFYRENLSLYHITGGWTDEQYELLKELDRARLVMTTLVYVEHDTSYTAD